MYVYVTVNFTLLELGFVLGYWHIWRDGVLTFCCCLIICSVTRKLAHYMVDVLEEHQVCTKISSD